MPAHVVVISHDTIGDQMAGPGIRYANLATALAKHVDVLLAVPSHSPEWQAAPKQLRSAHYTHYEWATLAPLVDGAQVVVCQPDLFHYFPQLAHGGWCLAFDDYDPLLPEWLAITALGEPKEQQFAWPYRMQMLQPHLLAGDFFFCASERQRDWLLGLLEGMGRINPYTYAEDHSLRRLVDVVSTGMSDEPPQHTRNVIRGVWPGIEPGDVIALWGGGVWPWLDPLTAVSAISIARKHVPNLKLVFPGTRLPNEKMSGLRTLLPETIRLADALGLKDTAVFFGDWVPFADWENVLMEADVALTLHSESLETRLAFRTRVLDYIWAGLPAVATQGDATCDLIERYNMGHIVPEKNAQAVADAIIDLVPQRHILGQNAERARQDLSWNNVIQPLLNFCQNPRPAPDKAALGGRAGPPHYVEVERQMERWKALAAAYERGKYMRFMRWLKSKVGR